MKKLPRTLRCAALRNSSEDTWRSYELFARYVMPCFQDQVAVQTASYEWAKANRKTVFSPNVAALRKAYTDAGVKPPEEFAARALGARDVEERK